MKNKIAGHFSIRELLYEILILFVGSVIFAASLNMFLLPAGIVIGGVTGISTILNILFKTPVGLFIIIINIPLVAVNWLIFGRKFIMRSLIGIVFTSAATDLITFLPVTLEDPLLCAIFGGVCMGVSLGLLYSRGITTGGTDLVACLLKRRFKRLSTARLVFVTDFIIVAASSFVTGEWNVIFYSVIAISISSYTTDLVLGGTSRAKVAYIFSAKTEEIANAITVKLERGVTVLYAKGWYSKNDKPVLMCVVKRQQLFDMKQLINSIDPKAFIIVSDASEVVGYGFESKAIN